MNKNLRVGCDLKKKAKPLTELIAPSNYPMAYFNMPKSACTTVKNILYYIQHGKWNPDPLNIHHQIRFNNIILRGGDLYEHRIKMKFDRPFVVFTFVRNPALRVFSTFVEKVWASGPYSFPGIRKTLGEAYNYRLGPMENGEYEPDDVLSGFKQFLRFVSDNLAGKTKIPPNAHWDVQSARINYIRASDCIGFVGRVETFANDMSYILGKAGWHDHSIATRRFNEGPRPPFGLSDLIDEETIELLQLLYKDDFLAFDYPFPCENVK